MRSDLYELFQLYVVIEMYWCCLVTFLRKRDIRKVKPEEWNARVMEYIRRL
jgi:hypothetical protein